MSGVVLVLDEDQVAELRRCAEAAYPEEACGLIVGRRDDGGFVASRLVPSPNRHAEPARSFEIDPAIHFALLRELRDLVSAPGQQPEDIIGHYHSHPDVPADPSPRDFAAAYDPAMLWVILSLAAGSVDTIGAWRIDPTLKPPAAFIDVPIVRVERKIP